MNPQMARVVLFLVGALLVVAFAGYSALLRITAKVAKRPAPKSWLARISFTLLGLGVGCFLYALFIEADWVEVTRLTVQTDKWPAGKVMRVAHLSDLHVDRESRALSRITEVLRDEKVDLIVFTGDSINQKESAPLFRSVFGGLPARLGRVAVRGNHDVYRWGKIDLFGGGVATELMTDAPLLLENDSLAICGAPFRALEGVEGCLKGAPPAAFVMFVYHSPDLVEALEPAPDLYLTGHTHGGQVAMPGYGALVTMSTFDKEYEAGRYQVGKTTMYVSRGIGFEPHLPRVRFFARPEITIIEIVGTGK
jgi:predicted MPP superfamily phosphohydrolase